MILRSLTTFSAAALLVTSIATGSIGEASAQPSQSSEVNCSVRANDAAAVDANQRLMRRFVDFINTADPKMAEELVSPGATFYVPGQPDPVKGPQGYLAIIGMMRSGFPDIRWAIEETVVEPNKVAARFTMRGTHRGPFFGLAPTGREIAVQALNIYHLCNGQIVKEFGQPDMMGLMQQIGALPR